MLLNPQELWQRKALIIRTRNSEALFVGFFRNLTHTYIISLMCLKSNTAPYEALYLLEWRDLRGQLGVFYNRFEVFDFGILYTCTNWDLTSDDDVLFQSIQVVGASTSRGVDKHAGRVLE